MRRPEPGEYAPFYAGYIEGVPEGEVLETLELGVEETRELLGGVPASAETYRYAPGKWSVREVVGHVVDTERLFAFRALHVARGDRAELPSMDQEVWAEGSNAHTRPVAALLDELEAVRRASLHLFRGLSPDVYGRTGVASGFEFTVRTFPWIVAGHEIHHRRLLRERYLPGILDGEEDG